MNLELCWDFGSIWFFFVMEFPRRETASREKKIQFLPSFLPSFIDSQHSRHDPIDPTHSNVVPVALSHQGFAPVLGKGTIGGPATSGTAISARDPLIQKMAHRLGGLVVGTVPDVGNLVIAVHRDRIIIAIVIAAAGSKFRFAFFQRQEHASGKGRLAPWIVLSKDQQDIAGNVPETIVKVTASSISVVGRFLPPLGNQRWRPHDRGKGGVASVAEGAAPNLVHLLYTEQKSMPIRRIGSRKEKKQ
jgi:hypothetical protein